MQIPTPAKWRDRVASPRDPLGRAARILLLAAVYALVGRLGLTIGPVQQFASLVWPPTGIALAALLVGGTRLWPGVFLGAFAVNAWTGAPALAAAGVAAGNALEALVGAHLVRRVQGPAWSLERVRGVLAFAGLAALLAPAISASVGVASLSAAGVVARGSVVETWRVWWLGDVVGALVVGTLLVAWSLPPRRALDPRRLAEAAALGAAVAAAAALVFLRQAVSPAAGFVQACLLIPLLVWSALRFEVRGATAAVFVASAVAVAGTALGRGPFVQDSLPESLLFLQTFMAVVAVAALLVGAVTGERAAAMRRAEVGEQALRRSGEELRRITDVTPHMLTRCSRDLRYLFVNRAYAQMLGRTPEEIAGRPIVEIMGSAGLETIRPHVEAVLQGRTVEYEDEVPFAGCGTRSLHVTYVPDVDDRGEVTGWIASIVDITERRRAEEALREASRRKTEFLGVLSHELRNPLAPIRNALLLLRSAPRDGERAGRALEVIERQTNQLARLVDDLLDVTRISQGKIQLRRERVDLAELVRQTVEDHRPVLDARGIALAARLGAEPLWIDGDAARVRQVVGNLLQNAAKFSNPGGHVDVAVERAGDGWATLRVADDGIGIDPQVLPRLFEPFAQADESLHRTLGGLGLGLALTRALVAMHGGTVQARSAGPGRGAEFTVSLPLVGGDAARREVAPAPRRAPAAARRVLVIEDNLDAADTLREALSLNGHEVAVAHRGEEGLAKVRAFEPEVVICDIGLPGLDGYEVARRIRAERGRWPTLIALTGYALPEDRERALEAGFDHHLAKPIEIGALQDVLAGLDAGARGAAAP